MYSCTFSHDGKKVHFTVLTRFKERHLLFVEWTEKHWTLVWGNSSAIAGIIIARRAKYTLDRAAALEKTHGLEQARGCYVVVLIVGAWVTAVSTTVSSGVYPFCRSVITDMGVRLSMFKILNQM